MLVRYCEGATGYSDSQPGKGVDDQPTAQQQLLPARQVQEPEPALDYAVPLGWSKRSKKMASYDARVPSSAPCHRPVQKVVHRRGADRRVGDGEPRERCLHDLVGEIVGGIAHRVRSRNHRDDIDRPAGGTRLCIRQGVLLPVARRKARREEHGPRRSRLEPGGLVAIARYAGPQPPLPAAASSAPGSAAERARRAASCSRISECRFWSRL